MESFEQKIKERNNLLKSQVESLTGRNELTEVIDTLLKAGVAEEDLVEKAKYIRREADGKGGYKYIYEEPKENKIKTDKVDKKEGKVSNLSIYSHKEGGMAATGEINGKKVSIRLPKEFVKTVDTFDNKEHRAKVKEMLLKEVTKSSESDLEKAEDNKKKEKIAKVMKEFKAGTLKTSSGEPVKDQKQAIAIAMSEAGMSVKKSTLSTVLKQNESDIEKGGEGSRGGKVIGHTKSGKPIYEIGNKVKYFHPGLNKHLTGKITDYKHSDDGNHTYTVKREGTTDYHEGIKQSDITFKKSENNDIEKSHLGEFSYSEKLGIKKTGKEIKEKFKANLQKEQSEASELKAKLGVLKTKIGEEPTKKCDYWGLDAYEDKGLDIPLVYDYSQMKGEEKMSPIAETLVVEAESQPKENITEMQYKYNDVVRKYIDCQKEILQINTILNNYKDADVYQLTISQATVLGF